MISNIVLVSIPLHRVIVKDIDMDEASIIQNAKKYILENSPWHLIYIKKYIRMLQTEAHS